MNPGTSLHFDGQALEEEQEAELKQEDLRREQEVHVRAVGDAGAILVYLPYSVLFGGCVKHS